MRNMEKNKRMEIFLLCFSASDWKNVAAQIGFHFPSFPSLSFLPLPSLPFPPSLPLSLCKTTNKMKRKKGQKTRQNKNNDTDST